MVGYPLQRWCFLLLLLLVFMVTVCGFSLRSKKNPRDEYLKKVMSWYATRLPPNFHLDIPTTVTFGIYVNSFDDISEAHMHCRIGLMVRQQWDDTRLAFGKDLNDSDVTVDPSSKSSVWVPDLFFPNEKRGQFHDITMPNRLLRIYRNGTVFYSIRVSLTVSCPMKLHKFPLDTQICSVEMESYTHTIKTLVFKWKEEKDEPIVISASLQLPQFRIYNYSTENCDKKHESGTYPCIRANFELKRDICYYLIQTYIPTSMIVILSWVSFWISVEAVPARISLGVLTILTTTTQSSGIQRSLPRVSYVKAIDVWMAMCLIFVFAALVEFAIVNVLVRRVEKMKAKLLDFQKTNRRLSVDREKMRSDSVSDKFSIGHILRHWKAVEIDQLCRTLFPIVFLVFNAIYWTCYLLIPG